MNDDQHIASESELGARLITTTPVLETVGNAHSQAGSSAKPPILKTRARATELN